MAKHPERTLQAWLVCIIQICKNRFGLISPWRDCAPAPATLALWELGKPQEVELGGCQGPMLAEHQCRSLRWGHLSRVLLWLGCPHSHLLPCILGWHFFARRSRCVAHRVCPPWCLPLFGSLKFLRGGEEAQKALCGVCKQVEMFIQVEIQVVTCPAEVSGVVTTFRGGS